MTVFGAAGRTGKLLVAQALEAGHEIVAFARTPSELGIEHGHLELVQGEWVPMLTDDPPAGDVKVGCLGKGAGTRASRADMAAFVLRQIDDDTYVHQAPVISS